MKNRLPDHVYEAKLHHLEKLSGELNIPIASSAWETVVKDVTGEIIDERKFISQSFTNNVNRLMMCVALQTTAINYANVDMRFINVLNERTPDGIFVVTGVNPLETIMNWSRGATAGDTNSGITIGRSNIAESPDLPQLQDLILHGTTAGRVEYQAQHLHTRDRNVGNNRFEVRQGRRMINNSGAVITVNEIGLSLFNDHMSIQMLLVRDVLAAPINIPNMGQLEVTLLKSAPMF